MSWPYIKNLDFAVTPECYITLRDMSFNGVTVPKGYTFDGITAKAPFTFIFSNNDLRKGIRAACFHDFMCENKNKFSRRQATSILIKLWKEDGLGNKLFTSWKPWLVYLFVEIYQIYKGWK